MEKVVYLDNAATSFPKPDIVYSFADKIYREFGANANRGGNPLSRKASDLIQSTRKTVARWFNVSSANKVIFSPSATIALNQVILGSLILPGGTIYVSPFEHNSVLRPVSYLQGIKAVKVKVLDVDKLTLEFDIEKIKTQFANFPPDMLILSHASNVCGVIPPVIEIGLLAKNANDKATVIIDGAQVSCMDGLPINEGIDYYVFSGHKALYGPFGAAGFIMCSDKKPVPVLFGGTGTGSENIFMPDTAPDTYEPGSMNLWAIAGLNASLKWIEETGRNKILTHYEKLKDMVLSSLIQIPNVVVYKPRGKMAGVISFNIKGVQPQSVENYLGSKNISVRAGLHCAPWTHDFLGTINIGGTVRVSPGYYNTYDDIALFLENIKKLI